MERLTSTRWSHQREGEVVILDCRDSFVYNLAHRFEELGISVVVHRSDAVTLDELIAWKPAALVLSPGPGHPDQAGISVDAVRYFSPRIPLLGICLGHQAIVRAFGGQVVPSGAPMHGKPSAVAHDATGLFDGLESPVQAGRYHSLMASEPLPAALRVCARADGLVMAIAHREHPTFGLQFHPESILTPSGYTMLANFLKCCDISK
ncbi:aminodeoxychorismate/anthranilate synthase component II [Bradymonas sediminis]|uniref:Aminodeoxychorismate/anthranilate synthase component II n=2 Tax=Bradymonas sediminis TaxID=1548548 RepID=A0A2Z4FL97_9DELT|nr:aminodeoxychorismate/anthranilate synthase component II [Bradymonas sediminis]